MQLDSAFHIDGLEILKGSRLLRASAKAIKSHSQDANVFQSAVQLLNMLLTVYSHSSCFDALVEEILDSNLALEIEIAMKQQQVCSPVKLITCPLRSNLCIVDLCLHVSRAPGCSAFCRC